MGRKRNRASVGNPDGTPRLDLFEPDAVSAAQLAADVLAAEAQPETPETSAAEAGQDGAFVFQEAPRVTEAPNASVLTEQAEDAPPPEVRTYYTKKQAVKKAEDTARWLLMIMESAAVMGLGEEAQLLDHEKQAISEPLSRMMARMDPRILDNIEKWSDPLILLFGFMTYGSRLYGIAQDRKDDDGGPSKPAPRAPSPGDNGKVVEQAPPVAAPADAVENAGPSAAITSQVAVPSTSFPS